MPLAIRCHDLHKTYSGKNPVEAVRGLDIEVDEGECFGLLGPNGAGKTTTIEILEGLSRPTSGEVEILGTNWASGAQHLREQVGISLQETRLSDRLTVLETVSLFRSFYSRGLEPAEALEFVSLNSKSSAWVSHLSGGQKQRLAIAVAIVGDPRLLFLDEPTTGLDPRSRRELWEIIGAFRRQGRTVMLTTHYMDEAERLCHRVAIVDQGKVIAQGTPRELIAGLGAQHVVEFSLKEFDSVQAIPECDALMRSLPFVNDVVLVEDWVRLSVERPHEVIPELLRLLESKGWKLASLSTRMTSLDDVFVQLTGRHLDEGGVPG